MLLRRIMQHVREQNWLAVALDFVIVVVGVLMAFQITSWSENRAASESADRHLDNLERALDAQAVMLGGLVGVYEEQIEYGRFVLETLEGETLAEADRARFEYGIAGLGQLHALDPAGVAPLIDLVLDGTIRVEDPDMLDLLRNYAWTYRGAQSVQDRIIERTNGAMQIIDSYAAVGPPASPDAPASFVAYDFERMRDSAELKAAIGTVLNMNIYDRRNMIGGRNGAEYMLELMRAQRRPEPVDAGEAE